MIRFWLPSAWLNSIGRVQLVREEVGQVVVEPGRLQLGGVERRLPLGAALAERVLELEQLEAGLRHLGQRAGDIGPQLHADAPRLGADRQRLPRGHGEARGGRPRRPAATRQRRRPRPQPASGRHDASREHSSVTHLSKPLVSSETGTADATTGLTSFSTQLRRRTPACGRRERREPAAKRLREPGAPPGSSRGGRGARRRCVPSCGSCRRGASPSGR